MTQVIESVLIKCSLVSSTETSCENTTKAKEVMRKISTTETVHVIIKF